MHGEATKRQLQWTDYRDGDGRMDHWLHLLKWQSSSSSVKKQKKDYIKHKQKQQQIKPLVADNYPCIFIHDVYQYPFLQQYHIQN